MGKKYIKKGSFQVQLEHFVYFYVIVYNILQMKPFLNGAPWHVFIVKLNNYAQFGLKGSGHYW